MKLTIKILALAFATGLVIAFAATPVDAQVKKSSKMMTKDAKAKVAEPQDGVVLEPRYQLFASRADRRELKMSYRRYQRAERARERAVKTKSRTKAARYLKAATQDFERALKGSDRVLNRTRRVAAKREAKRLMRAFSRAAYGAQLALGEAYTTRGAYRRALDAADRALALRPRDVMARSLKERIQLQRAAASSKGRGF